MEKLTDSELVVRIRNSDEEAFYVFCRRHWKSLYAHALMEIGNEDAAFEWVKGFFAEFWDRRRRLPDMTATAEEYFLRDGLRGLDRGDTLWNLMNLMEDAWGGVRRLPHVLGTLLEDKQLRYKWQNGKLKGRPE
ncbi:hypothetical protein [Parapedobacter sp. DT-150]|uniref:hypothetical protein n=1 Tax=Parapedobacter sp. DT-150 TaxID=3396162 RepID=UPI003F1BB9F7